MLRLRGLPVTGWSQWQQCYDSLTAIIYISLPLCPPPLNPRRYAENLLNCTLHMFDPEGALRCTGVRGSASDAQVRRLRPPAAGAGCCCHGLTGLRW